MSNLYIMHYGVGHDKGGHSGRYPWGSGKNPYGGQGTKSAIDVTKKENRKNMAKGLVGLAVAGPFGGFVGAAAGKNESPLKRMTSQYADMEGYLRDAVYEVYYHSDDDFFKGAEYLKEGLKNTEEFLNRPENKALKRTTEKILNQRIKARDDGIKLLKEIVGEYDLSELYNDSKTNNVSSSTKFFIDQSKEFIDEIAGKAKIDYTLPGVYKDLVKYYTEEDW